MKHKKVTLSIQPDGSAVVLKRKEALEKSDMLTTVVCTENEGYGIEPVDYVVDGVGYITLEHLGREVKKHLAAANWSQTFFADRCHVLPTVAARWANGKNFIPPECFADLKANQKIATSEENTSLSAGRKSWRRTLTIDSDMLTVVSDNPNYPASEGQIKVRCVPNLTTTEPDDYVYNKTGYITFEHLNRVVIDMIQKRTCTLPELAEKLGVNPSYLSLIKYTGKIISEDVFIRLQKLVIHAGRPRKKRKKRTC